MKEIAQETLKIIEDGSYTAPSGRRVELSESFKKAIDGTVLYNPNHFLKLNDQTHTPKQELRIAVTSESTTAAAQRLVADEGESRVVALNFASAKNPGGGFISGAKAQEEDLSRCSALYPCLLTQPRYYEENRASGSLLYLDYIIYSPDVPFFRDQTLQLVEKPFLVSIITAPAPNAGEVLRRDPSAKAQISETLKRRATKVLQVAKDQQHQTLILGAWGCGVFRNQPTEVAKVFDELLKSSAFSHAFERVVFAIYDRSQTQSTLKAFRICFEH